MHVRDLYVAFKDWYGGTIRNVIDDFKTLAHGEREAFLKIALENRHQIEDTRTLLSFFELHYELGRGAQLCDS